MDGEITRRRRRTTWLLGECEPFGGKTGYTENSAGSLPSAALRFDTLLRTVAGTAARWASRFFPLVRESFFFVGK